MIKELKLKELDVKISTPDGWQPLGSFFDKGLEESLSITFSVGDNKISITGSLAHKYEVIKPDDSLTWVESKDLKVGDIVLHKEGKAIISDIQYVGKQPIYDIEVVHPNHRYYSEGVSSHNTGKTTLFVQTCAQAQQLGYNVVYFDTEMKSFSVSHMEKLGIDFKAKGSTDGSSPGFFKIIKCGTIEEIDAHLMNFEKSGLADIIDVVIIDSVATAITQKQIDLGVGDNKQLGQHAYGIQKLFGKIRIWKERHQWAVGTINQMRRAPDIGGMFQAKAVNVKGIGGSNDTSWTKTGGRAYLHDLHQAVFMDNYKVEKNDLGEILKQYVKITTTKNMVGSTGRKIFVKLVQNEGFKDDETLIENLIEWNYISHQSAGNYWIYDSTEEDAEPVLKVKGLDNLLSAIKKEKGLLDRLYDLFLELAQQSIDEQDSSSDDEEDEDEEIEIED